MQRDLEIRPSISAVLCTFNGGAWLPEQLDSILHQQMPANEIVVFDDSSTDNTWTLLLGYEKEYPGVFRIYKNPEKLGAINNFAQAILHAKGDIIFLCDQDDIWLPDKVEKVVGLFKSHPWAAVIATDGYLISEAGERLPQSFWQQLQFDFLPHISGERRSLDLAFYLLTLGNMACGAMLAFRRQSILPYFQMPVPPELFHDYWIAIVAAMRQSLLLTDFKSTVYRLHASQTLGIQPLKPSQTIISESGSSHDKAIQIAFGISRLERVMPFLSAQDKDMVQLGSTLKLQMMNSLSLAKKEYFRGFKVLPRKTRLIKHWLKGGEYLRISWRDILWI